MDYSPTSRRVRKSTAKSDLYSTFVVHSDDEDDDRPRRTTIPKRQVEEQSGDLYATMIRKDDDPNEDEDDDELLPPLLKRIPKDFDAAVDSDDDTSISGTMIVKTDRSRAQSSNPTRISLRKEEIGEDEGSFSTFVVRSTGKEDEEEERESEESLSGTMVTRTRGRGGGGGSTMSRAVASMQAVEQLGFGKQKKGSGVASSSQGEEGQLRQQISKVSSSSIPDSVTREDPSTKYELLHELGKGSYGAVYKARDLKTSEMVAIKVISLSEGEEGYEEIRGEIEMLQQCSHPNVVRYLGSYQGEEYLWETY